MRRFLDCCKHRPEPPKSEPVDDLEVEALNEENISVSREVYNYPKFAKEFEPGPFIGFSLIAMLKAIFFKNLYPSKNCCKKQLYNRIPSIKWIKNYSLRGCFVADILAGLTVGIMHIPQGMGYALLATVPPINGLYTSFFPVLIYWIFGTSKHLSIGTFAVISLMVADSLADLAPKYVPPVGFNATAYLASNGNQASPYLSLDIYQARILIVMAHAFWVGVIQFAMYFFQLGFVTSYFTESFVAGFLSSCSIHVATSQLKYLFGIHLTAHAGIFKLPKIYIEFFSEKIPTIHVPSLIISIICITILVTVKIFINERYEKKLPVPIPVELIIIVFGTLISYLGKFSTVYDETVIGPIPAGIPGPQLPPFHIIQDMLPSCIFTAIVAYTINFSLADVFSKKHRYKINTTQELLAYGTTNIFASFFPCFTSGASLARTSLQDMAGGKTQLVSIISCIIMGLVLLFIAPLFRELPNACLASIIVVSLKNLILQVTQLPFYWKVSKIEFWTFVLTFLVVVILDVNYGIIAGVGFHVLAHITRSTQPYSTLLGHIPKTELYKDIRLYKKARPIRHIRIVRVQQELHATNSNNFKKAIYELVKVKPQDVLRQRDRIEAFKKKQLEKNLPFSEKYLPSFLANALKKKPGAEDNIPEVVKETDSVYSNPAFLSEYEGHAATQGHRVGPSMSEAEMPHPHPVNFVYDYSDEITSYHGSDSEFSDEEVVIEKGTLKMPKLPFRFLIIDCSPINFVDTVGVKTMRTIVSDFNEIGIKVYLAELSDATQERFKVMERVPFKGIRSRYLDDSIIHVSIHDAVVHALRYMKKR